MRVIETKIQALSLSDLIQLLSYCMTMNKHYMLTQKMDDAKKLQALGRSVEAELKKRLDSFILNIV